MPGNISVRDNTVDEGQEAFEIRTPRATYLYQKAGCAFSSVIDRNGKDWIGYRPKGGPKGSSRGIPNMGYETFGHPGYVSGNTVLVRSSETHVVLQSSADDRAWNVEWTLTATHASMTARSIATPVWLLYEGTPGGKFNPLAQHLLFSDGTRLNCDSRFRDPVPDPQWVAFCDPKSRRSMALAYEGPDSFVSTYWPMGGKGGMTVFGFGRTDNDGFGFHVCTVPFKFSFALVESIEFEEIAAFAKTYLLGK